MFQSKGGTPNRRDERLPSDYRAEGPADFMSQSPGFDNILQTVVRYRWVFAAFLAAAAILGGVAAFSRQPVFVVETTIKVGQSVGNGTLSLLESPSHVIALLEGTYIPYVASEYRAAHPDQNRQWRISASPSGNSIIVLRSMAGSERVPVYQEMQQRAISFILADHEALIEAERDLLSRELTSVERQIGWLEEQLTQARERRRALNEMTAAYRDQLVDLGGRMTGRVEEGSGPGTVEEPVLGGQAEERAGDGPSLGLSPSQMALMQLSLSQMGGIAELTLNDERRSLDQEIGSLQDAIRESQRMLFDLQARQNMIVPTQVILEPGRVLAGETASRLEVFAVYLLGGFASAIIFVTLLAGIRRGRSV